VGEAMTWDDFIGQQDITIWISTIR
jgi:hypothetical protein